MTSFEERERGFEAKFAHDQDMQFRLVARRDKLFAQWVASELKLPDSAQGELMASVMHVADGAGHDDRILAHAAARFTEQGQFPLDAYLASALSRCGIEAQEHLLEAPLG